MLLLLMRNKSHVVDAITKQKLCCCCSHNKTKAMLLMSNSCRDARTQPIHVVVFVVVVATNKSQMVVVFVVVATNKSRVIDARLLLFCYGKSHVIDAITKQGPSCNKTKAILLLLLSQQNKSHVIDAITKQEPSCLC